MRFREAVDALAPDEQLLVLNRLTVGCGRLAHAARLALTDAQCGRVLDQLAGAERALADTLARLGSGSPPAADSPPAAGDPAGDAGGAGLRVLSWSDLLATRLPAERAALTADLEEVAHQARELGRAVHDDATTDHLRRHLAALTAALADLRRRLAVAVES